MDSERSQDRGEIMLDDRKVDPDRREAVSGSIPETAENAARVGNYRVQCGG
jgi:hypothetical protein